MGTSKKKTTTTVTNRDLLLLLDRAGAIVRGAAKQLRSAKATGTGTTAAAKRFDKGCPPPEVIEVKRFDKGCPPPASLTSLSASKNRGLKRRVSNRISDAELLLGAAKSLLGRARKGSDKSPLGWKPS